MLTSKKTKPKLNYPLIKEWLGYTLTHSYPESIQKDINPSWEYKDEDIKLHIGFSAGQNLWTIEVDYDDVHFGFYWGKTEMGTRRLIESYIKEHINTMNKLLDKIK